QNADIFLDLVELNLYRKGLRLEYKNDQPEFIVKSGNIEKWDLEAIGQQITLISKGKGNLYAQHKIEGKNKIDAEILEIFPDFISRSSGVLSVNYRHESRDGEHQAYELSFSGDSIGINSDKIPMPIKK